MRQSLPAHHQHSELSFLVGRKNALIDALDSVAAARAEPANAPFGFGLDRQNDLAASEGNEAQAIEQTSQIEAEIPGLSLAKFDQEKSILGLDLIHRRTDPVAIRAA